MRESLPAGYGDWLAELKAQIEALEEDTSLSSMARGLALMPLQREVYNLQSLYGEGLDARSHGEAFLEVLTSRAGSDGVYLLDEPDAALSFGGTLALVAVLLDLVATGAQVVVATHSPVLAALPGATLREVGSWGIRPARWEDLELTASWRQFLAEPESFLRHLR